MPPQFVVGTGQIISAWEQTSGQIDIVIYDRTVVPPVLLDQANGIFPIEAVVATVEVKSILNATELRMAHDAAEKVAAFVHAPPVGMPTHPASHAIEHVIPFVLAFDTDLSPTGKSELERYESMHSPNDPPLRGLCVVERGFWTFGKTWSENSSSCTQGAVVGMVAALVNACQRVANTRLQPDLRDYLDRPLPALPARLPSII